MMRSSLLETKIQSHSFSEQYLEPLMPKASFKRVGIFFDRANAVLNPKLVGGKG